MESNLPNRISKFPKITNAQARFSLICIQAMQRQTRLSRLGFSVLAWSKVNSASSALRKGPLRPSTSATFVTHLSLSFLVSHVSTCKRNTSRILRDDFRMQYFTYLDPRVASYWFISSFFSQVPQFLSFILLSFLHGYSLTKMSSTKVALHSFDFHALNVCSATGHLIVRHHSPGFCEWQRAKDTTLWMYQGRLPPSAQV